MRCNCALGAILSVLLVAPLCGADDLAAAQRLLLTGKYAEAKAAFEKLQANEPVAATIGLAKTKSSVGETAAAEKILADACAKNPQAAPLFAERAELAFARGDYATAQKHVDASLAASENELAARWIKAELLRSAGKLKEADAAYEWFVDYYNAADKVDDPEALRYIGLGAAQYARWNGNSSQFHFLVNKLYPKALKLNDAFWPAHLAAALLFLEKYNEGDAASELAAALVTNPNAAEVHAAKAQLALQKYKLEEAEVAITRALEINPRLVWAHQLKADKLLADFRPAEALAVLEETRKLNPVDDGTLGRLAAVYGLLDGLKDDPAGTRMGDVIAATTARNEHCGEFFAALGETFDLVRRYPAAAKYYAEAQRRMPQLVSIPGQLGLVYMRLGDEALAAPLLKESFRVDPFNVRVKNTLAVLDVLAKYAVIETEHFVIKFDRGTDERLAQYAAKYLESQVYPELVAKLGYAPPGKSLFEIFNRSGSTSGHGWFSARMVGLPYVGTVGACAGKMVALASPTDMPRKFNWARVLKHEFVHVVNLQQTNFNIPHWYTEALATWYEDRPRPPSWNALLAKRFAADKLYTLDNINFGFIRPASSDDWALAYCQAELYVEYLLERFGKEAPAKLLDAYGRNLSTSAAIDELFHVKQLDFEKGYHEFVKKVVDGLGPLAVHESGRSFAELQREYEKDTKNALLAAQLALAQLQRQNLPEARKLASAALVTEPKHALASYVLARVVLTIGDTAEALRLLTASLDENNPHEQHLALLAALREKEGDAQEALRLYDLGAKRFGHSEVWPRALARVYLKANQPEKLRPVLERLADLDYDDPLVRKKLAQLAIEAKDYPAAAHWAQEAVYIDVADAEAHANLAAALAAQEKHAEAAEEYAFAVELKPEQSDWLFSQAESLVKAQKPAAAREAINRLLKKEPEHAGAKELLEKLPK